jgi:hypothetical protein
MGSTRKKFIGRKKLLQFLWQQVCYNLLSARGKNSCMFASVIDDVVAKGGKQQKSKVLIISLIKEA